MHLPVVHIGENVPGEALRRQNGKRFGMDVEQQKKAISGYMASVRFMDQQVGRLLDALDRLDLRKETIVIFISDHGYNLGEHDCWSKISLWEGSIRVPTIISVPGGKYKNHSGTINDQIVELIDLYPTLTQLLGFENETPEILQGESLVPLMMNPNAMNNADQYAYTVSYQGEAASLRTNQWRYTRWGDKIKEGNEELYDHGANPEENNNLIDDPAAQQTLDVLRSRFEKVRQKARNGLE